MMIVTTNKLTKAEFPHCYTYHLYSAACELSMDIVLRIVQRIDTV